jgi:hypothetical protein
VPFTLLSSSVCDNADRKLSIASGNASVASSTRPRPTRVHMSDMTLTCALPNGRGCAASLSDALRQARPPRSRQAFCFARLPHTSIEHHWPVRARELS